jgi:hypothetical protein
MWPFLHINKHNIRTWTEVNERKTLAENLNDVPILFRQATHMGADILFFLTIRSISGGLENACACQFSS